MKGIFKGVYRNKGSFTDQKTGEYIEYDHAVFTVLVPFKTSKAHIEGVGQEAAQKMKCLWENLSTVCNSDNYDDGQTTFKSCKDFQPFLGLTVDIERDQYGNLEALGFRKKDIQKWAVRNYLIQ